MASKYFLNFIIFVIFLLPAFIWYRQTGDLAVYSSNDVPAGQFLYVLSKLMGMYALLCLMCQCIASLLEKTNTIQFCWLGLPHRAFGIIVVVLAATHFLLFFFAASSRQGYLAWNLFLPNFQDYFHTYLSLGLIGLWFLFIVLFSGIFRAMFSKSKLRFLHNAYWIVIVLTLIHSLTIGTEVQSEAGVMFFGALGLVIFVLLINFLIISKKSTPVVSRRIL